MRWSSGGGRRRCTGSEFEITAYGPDATTRRAPSTPSPAAHVDADAWCAVVVAEPGVDGRDRERGVRRGTLEVRVALLHAPDDRGVEPDAEVEQEVADVAVGRWRDTEPDPPCRSRAPASRSSGAARVDRRRTRCRGCGRTRWSSRPGAARARWSMPASPLRGLVERAVTGEHRDDVESVGRRVAGELGRVTRPGRRPRRRSCVDRERIGPRPRVRAW